MFSRFVLVVLHSLIMKYMWANQNIKDSMDMQACKEDFVFKADYNVKTIDNLQRTSPKKVKRFRSAFTTDQVNYLEKQFKKFPYIGNAHRKEVAVALSIPERAVKIWFQNRRMKEKKETTNKEFDDESSKRKSTEFAKDQLNNVAEQSANEQPYSLPMLTDINKPNSDQIMMKHDTSFTSNIAPLVQDLGSTNLKDPMKIDTSKSSGVYATPQINTAEFSINLCKKYKSEPIYKPNNIKANLAKNHDVNLVTEQPMVYKMLDQMKPEDLSLSRKVILPPPSQAQAPHNPGYISMLPTVSPFYAQPYYSASGVIWKPVNVMPAVPSPVSSMPVSVPNFGQVSQATVPKKCCSCDCHVKPIRPTNCQQQAPSPQYIITALQFPNSSVNKF